MSKLKLNTDYLNKPIESDTAIEEILFLSGRIPYFIQMICKNCVIYANQNKTPSITPIELEAVIKLLTAREEQVDRTSYITPISAGAFQANVWSRSEPILTTAVLAAIAFHPHADRKERYISLEQIEGIFHEHRVTFKHRELVAILDELYDIQILEVQHPLTDKTTYRISVDLFRRWFIKHHHLEWAIGRLRGDINHGE